MQKFLRKLNWLLVAQFGIDFRLMLSSFRGVPRYLSDLYKFHKQFSGKIILYPCLSDYYQEGGNTKSEYFWQDLFIAQKVFQANPLKHVDIGSRIDSFVAHVASFREIEVFDIRNVSTKISGVIFRQADFMSEDLTRSDYCDSLSCLHALEHFGLGRYGDPINPEGYKLGLRNMSNMLKPGGTFYLSVPIGAPRVEFNAHRVFSPTLLRKIAVEHKLQLKEFLWLDRERVLKQSQNYDADMEFLGHQEYNLGIFIFQKSDK